LAFGYVSAGHAAVFNWTVTTPFPNDAELPWLSWKRGL
jgi:hypothetical protein